MLSETFYVKHSHILIDGNWLRGNLGWSCVCVCLGVCVAFNETVAYHNERGCSWFEASGLTLLKVISANAMVFAICWDCLHLPR